MDNNQFQPSDCLSKGLITGFLKTSAASGLYRNFQSFAEIKFLLGPPIGAKDGDYPAVILNFVDDLGMRLDKPVLEVHPRADGGFNIIRDMLVAMKMYIDYPDALFEKYTPARGDMYFDDIEKKIEPYIEELKDYMENFSEKNENKKDVIKLLVKRGHTMFAGTYFSLN